jgi:hypothetical protein
MASLAAGTQGIRRLRTLAHGKRGHTELYVMNTLVALFRPYRPFQWVANN